MSDGLAYLQLALGTTPFKFICGCLEHTDTIRLLRDCRNLADRIATIAGGGTASCKYRSIDRGNE